MVQGKNLRKKSQEKIHTVASTLAKKEQSRGGRAMCGIGKSTLWPQPWQKKSKVEGVGPCVA
jgi:hypothetical protein